jgi:hypothetical protein
MYISTILRGVADLRHLDRDALAELAITLRAPPAGWHTESGWPVFGVR